ncbi:hypothetical protein CDAR_292771 [Caerostris darwini]|uniref:Uncharacterized protein n=1 Tax=Caerostris darwini TaxID=1538125 RepID=A0AAV4SFY7_9ARAC|nr:hypothetical protein CDAR_292771 [Caerostris darwini]
MRNNALFSVETRHLRVSSLECCRYLSLNRGVALKSVALSVLSAPPPTHQTPLKTAPPGRHRGVTHREKIKKRRCSAGSIACVTAFRESFTQSSCNRGNGM